MLASRSRPLTANVWERGTKPISKIAPRPGAPSILVLRLKRQCMHTCNTRLHKESVQELFPDQRCKHPFATSTRSHSVLPYTHVYMQHCNTRLDTQESLQVLVGGLTLAATLDRESGELVTVTVGVRPNTRSRKLGRSPLALRMYQMIAMTEIPTPTPNSGIQTQRLLPTVARGE